MKYQTLIGAITSHVIYLQLSRNTTNVTSGDQLVSLFEKSLEGNLCYVIRTLQNSTYPEAGYPDRFGPSGKFVENSTKLTCLEITGYRIKYSIVLWLLELQIRRGLKV